MDIKRDVQKKGLTLRQKETEKETEKQTKTNLLTHT